MGTIAWHACNGLMEADLLRRVVAPETGAAGSLEPFARDLSWPFRKAMAAMNRLRWHSIHDDFFDRWVSSQIEPGMNFYGWLHQSLACIRKCHQGGGKTFVDRGSVEPRLQRRWLQEEYARHGLRQDPMTSRNVERMVREADETDVVVAASTLVAQSYLAAGYPPAKVGVNNLGVDFKQPAEKDQFHEGEFRMVFVGQVSLQKGVPDLLRAWRKFSHSKAELVLAGIIPRREVAVIEPLLRESRRVVWNGHCADVPALLKNCDVLVLPSAQDGFGLVVLEAFAAGLPVIVSDRVGAKDCVTEGKNGFVFRFGDVSALQERLEWFLQDMGRARFMRAAALETAANMSWKNYGERLVSLLKAACAR